MKKAVFLDRDGTISEDVGSLYRPEDIVFIDGSIEALKALQKDYLLFIVTNQSGIGKGDYTLEQFREFDSRYRGILAREGVRIEQTYCCPHTSRHRCVCMKPSTYHAIAAAREYGIDLIQSWAVGDHPHDVEMGLRAGMRAAYLLSGHGAKHRRDLNVEPTLIAPDLKEAVRLIASNFLI